MYTVIPTDKFSKDVEYYVKKKKFKHIGNDIGKIVTALEGGHLLGDDIPGFQHDFNGQAYKVRAANTDTHVGKSNGYRIIYYAIRDDLEIYLLTIYYKKEDNRIPSNNDIIDIIEMYCL